MHIKSLGKSFSKMRSPSATSVTVLCLWLYLAFSPVQGANAGQRSLLQANTTNSSAVPVPAPAGNLADTLNVTASAPPPLANGTANGTTNGTHHSTKDKIHDEIDKIKSQGGGTQIAAIVIGAVMLLGIITCLLCCLFRRGGQWRIPMPAFIRRRFGPKDKYSRYMDSAFDDGF